MNPEKVIQSSGDGSSTYMVLIFWIDSFQLLANVKSDVERRLHLYKTPLWSGSWHCRGQILFPVKWNFFTHPTVRWCHFNAIWFAPPCWIFSLNCCITCWCVINFTCWKNVRVARGAHFNWGHFSSWYAVDLNGKVPARECLNDSGRTDFYMIVGIYCLQLHSYSKQVALVFFNFSLKWLDFDKQSNLLLANIYFKEINRWRKQFCL